MPETLLNETEHAKALRMLETDLIGGFTTIGKDDSPRAVPVWFWWEDSRVFVLTKHDAHKLTHIRRCSPVLFHLNAGGEFGDDMVILHAPPRSRTSRRRRGSPPGMRPTRRSTPQPSRTSAWAWTTSRRCSTR